MGRQRVRFRVPVIVATAVLVSGTVMAYAGQAALPPDPPPDPPPDSLPSAPPTGGSPTGSPVASNGQLKVCGNRLCNERGEEIQLRGMSTHGLQWYADCVNDKSLDALASDWKADVLRISMYIQEGGYESDPERFTELVDGIIDQVTARGMYAIVDWHMLDPGDPNENLSRAKTFFTEIAQRHKDKNNIIYEIANEPSGVSWSAIKSYAEELIPVIREQDQDGVVLVGTRAWSSLGVSEDGDEDEVAGAKVDAENVMYTFHFYAASHGSEYLDTLRKAADKLPMFVTEFGTQNSAGEEDNDFEQAQQYLDLMAEKKISWTNWNYSDDERSGAVFKEGTCPSGEFGGSGSLKEAGAWIKERIRGRDGSPADPPSQDPSTTPTASPTATGTPTESAEPEESDEPDETPEE